MSIRHDELACGHDCNVISIVDGNETQFIIDTSRNGDYVTLSISKYTSTRRRSNYISLHLQPSEFEDLAQIMQTIIELMAEDVCRA